MVGLVREVAIRSGQEEEEEVMRSEEQEQEVVVVVEARYCVQVVCFL